MSPKKFISVFSKMKNILIPIIKIRGENLPLMLQTKFLRALMDGKLRFSDHFNFVCKQISHSTGVVKMYQITILNHHRDHYFTL